MSRTEFGSSRVIAVVGSRGKANVSVSDWAAMLPAPALFAVALGGAIGSLARWGVLEIVTDDAAVVAGDAATRALMALFAINILGSLLLGVLIAHRDLMKDNQFLAMGTGFTGGLTTFSSFAVDVAEQLDSGRFLDAAANSAGTAAAALLAAGVGYRLGVISR